MTVTVTVALLPLADAVIVTVPVDTPVTVPDPLTVARLVFEDVQENDTPFTTLPEASRAVAWSETVEPTSTDGLDGVMLIVLTVPPPGDDDVTVMADVADFPPLDAVIVAEPAATPVTLPVWLTVATALFDDDHAIVAP